MTSFASAEDAARAWASARGISGKRGRQYLVTRDVIGVDSEGGDLVRLVTWRPIFTGGRAVRSYRELGGLLLKDGAIRSCPGGYEIAL